MTHSPSIHPADGKLGVLLPGMGAVATTMMAGVLLARRHRALAIGSLTQMGTLQLGTAAGERFARIADVVPLTALGQMEFGGWDIFPDSAWEAAQHAKVVEQGHLDAVRSELEAIRPMPAACYPGYVKRLHGTHLKTARSKAEMVEQLRQDIRDFKGERGCKRLVSIWCGSTEAWRSPSEVHRTVRSFEACLARDDEGISNAQLYAWALLQERVPFANGSPNLCVDFPAARELAEELRVPVVGKDLQTGQTLVKTMLAPGLRARALGLAGWYSTNILGNRDGEVLDDPGSYHAKELSKLGVLEEILRPDLHPELYGEIVHKVRIEYYRPRGDAKEGWDNVDLVGWLGYPMQLRINFSCRDSILAAPLVLDLALLLDLAARAGFHGTQEWLGLYFKSPMTASERAATEHDVFRQRAALDSTLRKLVDASHGPPAADRR
jgi:myo-inositol-1-phosphate synthase